MMVHSAGHKQRAKRYAITADCAIGENNDRNASVDCGLRLGTYTIKRRDKPGTSFASSERDVNCFRAPATVIQVLQRGKLLVRQDGVRNAKTVGVLFRRFEQI